jgi:RNA:NAD 2'-phosphotransferase (TPT1/KptA family)
VQGHTIKEVSDEHLLEEIKDPFKYEEVVHGTYLKVVEPIMATGLNKMARNHVRKTLLM